jgi:hypothetical protein
MLEKMARAIYDAEHLACWGVRDTDEGWSWVYAQPYLDQAKAALHSLKDLDEGTVEAMDDALSEQTREREGISRPELAEIAFTAAIDHILNGEP